MFRVLLVVGLALATNVSWAQPGVTYPKVYGPTGSLYGPTQAHYQYQRQYGRAWVSPTGRVASPLGSVAAANGVAVSPYRVVRPVRFGYPVGGYGLPYGPFVGGVQVRTPWVNVGVNRGVAVAVPGVVQYGNGPFYHQGWESVAPVVRQAHPLWVGQNPFDNEVLARARLEEQLRWQRPVVVPKTNPRPRLQVVESSPEMKARSLKYRINGDVWFRKQQYSTAVSRYKSAVQAASDVAHNHYRLGFAMVAAGHPELAVKSFRRGVEIDPLSPQTGITLDELFGPENALAKSSYLLSGADWVREDIRDPDRLFVMGVLLHFDGQEDKGAEFFETAYRLAGRGDHLLAFLRPAVAEAPPAAPPAAPAVPAPPQPNAPAANLPQPNPGAAAEPPNGPLLPLLPQK